MIRRKFLGALAALIGTPAALWGKEKKPNKSSHRIFYATEKIIISPRRLYLNGKRSFALSVKLQDSSLGKLVVYDIFHRTLIWNYKDNMDYIGYLTADKNYYYITVPTKSNLIVQPSVQIYITNQSEGFDKEINISQIANVSSSKIDDTTCYRIQIPKTELEIIL